jgi:[glutamine synthetase] adenylyltransferase / [glutamine synthetase]-adenylyl-L-tyrosine phosphorylase
VPRTAEKRLIELAEQIDEARASALLKELGRLPERSPGVLLGTAFPPLTPVVGWQVEAVERLFQEGWRVERRASDTLARVLGAVGDLTDAERVRSRLRQAVWAEKARIALRELLPHLLGGAPIRVTAHELSDLADAAFEVALAEASTRVASELGEPMRRDGDRSRFVVLGMGKLGGGELNAGSDVDVMFFYDTDDGAGAVSLHDHWTRVARRLVATIDAHTEDGVVWRVDLRLRPEGGQGPIVNSVAAAERYYETWGRLWERAAMLRARAVAGDRELGRELDREVVMPFVYRREVDPAIATALAELVERSRAELSAAPERDLKLGPGGIREAEFFIQSLQLIWGGREPSLRVPGSLPALERLKSAGFVTDREARSITRAYSLLRRAEHHVQWMTGLQTHLVPEASADRERLARTLGYADCAALESDLSRARAVVHKLFRSLAPSAPRPPPRHRTLLELLDQGESELGAAAEREFGSAELGEHLAALGRRPDGLLGSLTRERYPELGDLLLDAIGASADPVQAARTLRSFFQRFITPAPYVAALGGDERAARRLVTVLGASAFVGDAIVGRPDLIDVILFGDGGVGDARATLSAELETFERGTPAGSDPHDVREAFVAALRRAKRRVMVQVAVADLAGTVDTREATRTLSDLADQVLDLSVRFELVRARAGPFDAAVLRDQLAAPARGLAVVAVGKLGGREIGYGSDLDVLFVYEPSAAPAAADPSEFFVRRAQNIVRAISELHPAGPGYELDTRLRPSGSEGLLVTSLASFARYHGVRLDRAAGDDGPSVLSSGAAWERQALLRARACAGDLELGARVIAVAEQAAYERGAPPAAEVHRLRLRMERELGRERAGRYDLKTGRGGLLDVEFAAQWLQMRHGKDPRVRTTETLQVLEALGVLGYLGPADFETLRDGYTFLRRLEQRIHVLNGTGSTQIDADAPGLPELARRMGIESTARTAEKDALLERYRDVTRAVRASYERVLGVASE